MRSLDKTHVAILMCTYNGAAFIEEQLDSFFEQTHDNWSLWVSDDNSTDQTLKIIENYQTRFPDRKISVFTGPQKGFCWNFQSLLQRKIEADFFAISDQDDIWLPEKLTRAIEIMSSKQIDLYGGRTITLSKTGQKVGHSPLFTKELSFKNALVQSVMGGNTMVLSKSFVQVLQHTKVMDVASHDWWLYLLCTGSNARVFYDTHATILYRQHGGNIIGANSGLRARIYRIQRLFRGDFTNWNEGNIKALKAHFDILKIEAQTDVVQFERLRAKRGFRAMFDLAKARYYRQTQLGQMGLSLGAWLGRL